MPAIGPTLGQLIANHCNTFMKEAGSEYKGYSGPLSQKNPSYFLKFCNGVANGVASGSPSINFITADTGMSGAPTKPGIGAGVGIIVDKEWFHKNLYINLRQETISRYKSTIHKSWDNKDPGGFLSALCKGISYGISDHFPTAFTLNSVHPTIYAGRGEIPKGNFSGLSKEAIQGLIISNLAGFTGDALQIFVKTISSTYVEAIHKHSTSFVIITGTCSPGRSQVCGILNVGVGTGIAV